MHLPMAPHALHIPGWMDEELRLLAFHAKASKTDLMRAMIAVGLASCWGHLRDGAHGAHPILDGLGTSHATGTPDVQALFARLVASAPRPTADALHGAIASSHTTHAAPSDQLGADGARALDTA